MSKFNDYHLNENILKTLNEINFVNPTPIQELAIPQIVDGRDVIACAQTGTGKTAAFMLPILNFLSENPAKKWNGAQVLVLVPTRELAMQVADEAKRFSKHLPHIKTACVYGGVPYPLQKRMLSRGYDILVATPGRLMDHMERGRINLSQVKIFVLDEADRMLDMGFIEPIEHIASQIPTERQTLLFSATIDRKIIPFSKKLQNNPFEIKIEPDRTTKNNIDQQLYYVDDRKHKIQILEHLLQNLEINQSIIFTSTINQTGELADYLQEGGYSTEALHGDMNQRQRTRTINSLRKGNIQILIATDVAARGIDISTISHVINFDLPFQSEDFIHRIGRTGRAGAKGTAITFATYKEDKMIHRINELNGTPLKTFTIEGMEPRPFDKNAINQTRKRKRGRSGSGPRRLESGSPLQIKKPYREQARDQSWDQRREQPRDQRREQPRDQNWEQRREPKRDQNWDQKPSRQSPRFEGKPDYEKGNKGKPFYQAHKKEKSSQGNSGTAFFDPFTNDYGFQKKEKNGKNFPRKRSNASSTPFPRKKQWSKANA